MYKILHEIIKNIKDKPTRYTIVVIAVIVIGIVIQRMGSDFKMIIGLIVLSILVVIVFSIDIKLSSGEYEKGQESISKVVTFNAVSGGYNFDFYDYFETVVRNTKKIFT